MSEDTRHSYSQDFWFPLMGKDLPRARSQPIHPVMVKDGKAGIFAHGLRGKFAVGTKVGLEMREHRVVVAEVEDGVPMHEPRFWDDRDPLMELQLPEGAPEALSAGVPPSAMLFDGEGGLQVLPIRVEEHEADILGPRVIDELQYPSDRTEPPVIVRHVVKGPAYEDWTAGRLRKLEALVCSQSFRHDPLASLADDDGWVGWKVRNKILCQSGADDGALRERFVREVFQRQGENGSWSDSPLRTAYGILHGLSVDVPPDVPRMRKAAEWLLNWPAPVGRPGMWMLSEKHLQEWNTGKNDEGGTGGGSFPLGTTDDETGYVREEAQQRVVPTCARHFSGLCDAMLHVSATAADALCRCGYEDHPRVKAYANSMLQLAAMFGYFCACWGPLNFEREVDHLVKGEPDFNRKTEELDVALRSFPYGYGRDADDLRSLANFPQCPGTHRPDLADTNGWSPYQWKDIGLPNHFAVVGAYWQNADCWAKTNRVLTQFPGCRGSITEFFALFQCHLYQTSLGEWDQGFPAGIFRWIAEVTRRARAEETFEDSQLLRFAKLMVLRTIPWLREHQNEEGMWNHEGLGRHSGGRDYHSLGPRLATYHIVSALSEFGLLGKLRPSAPPTGADDVLGSGSNSSA